MPHNFLIEQFLLEAIADPKADLIAIPVSTKVNNPDNDFAECIKPLQ